MRKSNDFFGQLLSRGPSQSTLFWVLKEMKKEGRSSEVIRECLKALSIYPDDIRLRGLLAESYLDVGFVGQAEAELDRVSAEIANLVSPFKLQAYIYIRQQRAEEAIKALRRYLAHNPDDREALDLLDRVEQKQKSVTEPAQAEQAPEYQQPTEEVSPPAEEQREEMPELATPTLDRQAPEYQQPVEEPPPPAEEQREEMPELATPTLAEIHYNQGQIQEAIRIYEKVLLENPDDDVSQKRLSELRASIDEETPTQVVAEDKTRTSKKEVISVLEGWLERIKESSNA